MYVCWDVLCLQKALKSSKLMATWEQTIVVPDFSLVVQQGEQLLVERLYSCLSLAQKAGALVSGYQALSTAWSQGKLRYLIVAENIAPSRAAEYHQWCEQQHIPWMTFSSKEELGKRLGKLSRSAVGLLDPHFCNLCAVTRTALEKWRDSQSRFFTHQASSYTQK